MAYLWPFLWFGLCCVHDMLKAWFKDYLAEILALRDCLDSAKIALNAVLWPDCGRLCELCVICPKKCLGTIWIKKINSDC